MYKKYRTVWRSSNAHLAVFAAGSMYGVQAYGITPAECISMGATCNVVSTTTELAQALSATGNTNTIVLGNDITLTSNITAQMLASNRQNIVIDGAGFKLNTGRYQINVLDNTGAAWGGVVGSLKFQNFDAITSTTENSYPVARIGPDATVNLVYDNINNLTNSMYAVMGNMGTGGTPNRTSEVVFGNLGPVNLTYGPNHQFAQASKIRFTGNFNLSATGPAGTYNTVFWSNGQTIDNQMFFDSQAHVDIRATFLTIVNGRLNNDAYQYQMADGAYLKLRTPQNVFGRDNAGLKLGTYTASGFGGGVILDLADFNGNAYAGHAISNLGGDVGVLTNGRATNGDVIFNVANQSVLNFSGATNAGFYVAKNSGIGGDIYIRSDAVMNATTANGFILDHLGVGKLFAVNDSNGVINAQKGMVLNASGSADSITLQNKGLINTSVAGLELNMNASSKTVQIDMRGGTIDASAGVGVDVLGQTVLSLQGGDIYARNSAIGLQLGNQLRQQIQGLNIHVQGTGTGISALSGTNLANISANILVQGGSGGTGLLIKDGASNTTVLSNTVDIQATGENAIRVVGTQAKTLEMDGTVTGKVEFENALDNTVVMRQGSNFQGQLVMGSGNDTVTLNQNTNVLAALDLGAGDDTLRLQTGTVLQGNTQLGAGNDQVVLTQANVNDVRMGQIDGGGGVNILSMDRSEWVLGASNRLINMNQIHLTNSRLELNHSNNVQNTTAILDTNSHLVFGTTYTNSFNGLIDGNGTVDLKGSLRLSNSNTLSGQWNIHGTGHLSASDLNQFGAAAVHNQGQLTLDNLNTFNQVLTGNGLFTIMNKPSGFTFGNGVGQGFTGTVELNNTQMDLTGNNLTVLAPATLSLAQNARAKLYSDQTIGSVKFAGGTLDTTMVSPIQSNLLTVNEILFQDTTGTGQFGTINLNTALPPVPPPSGNFLDQDDIAVQGGVQVIRATRVREEGRILDVTLSDVRPIPQINSVQDSDGNVVVATYDYAAVATNRTDLSGGPGMYVSYLLKKLQTNTNLVLTTEGARSAELIAQLTGNGDVTIKAPNQRVTLQNSANNYSGSTVVSSGTLVLGNDRVLGNTSRLELVANASVDWNGVEQSVGGLNLAQDSRFDLNGGHIIVTGDGVSSAMLTGTGVMEFTGGTTIINGAHEQLVADVVVRTDSGVALTDVGALGRSSLLADGRVTFARANGHFSNTIVGSGVVAVSDAQVNLTANNADFTGAFEIAADGQLRAQSVAALGAGTVQNSGQLQVNTDAGTTQIFRTQVQGSGNFIKLGAGVLGVDNLIQHTGKTVIQQGTLVLNSESATLAGSQVHIQAAGVLAGYGTIQTNVLNEGRLTVSNAFGTVGAGTGTLIINGDLQNHAAVDLVGQQPGNHLLVQGDYSAHSDLYVSAALAGDETVIDTLTVEGSTSGHTKVFVTNHGGHGAQTTQGIEVVEVLGDSSGTFGLAKRVVAGAYDYQLVQQGKNWFLQSALRGVRPEVGGYIANQEIAKTMFQQSYAERLRGRNPDNGAWGYIRSERMESLAANEIDQTIYQHTMQIGSDVWQSDASESGQWTVGVMAGAGKARSRNSNPRMEERADTSVDGYAFGGYASWHQQDDTHGDSTYVDSWLQYGWFDNTLKGTDLGSESYSSRVTSASVEVGHQMVLTKQENSTIAFTPSMQITAYARHSDHFVESSATHVENQNQKAFYSKAGAKVSAEIQADDSMTYQPHAGLYWGYHSAQAQVTLDDETFISNRPKSVLEAQVGVMVEKSKHWDLSLYLGGQVGKDNYSQLEGSIGVRYQW